MIAAVKKCLMAEAQALLSLANSIDSETLIPFLDRLSNCKGKRCFTGVGKSLIVAQKIADSFSSIGYSSIVIDPLSALHGNLGVLSANDIVVAISNSGETDILIDSLNHIVSMGVEIVSITGNEDSTIAKLSSCHYLVNTNEAGAFGIVPSSTTTAVVALGDAFLCALIVRDNLTVEDFYKFHPRGALARRDNSEPFP